MTLDFVFFLVLVIGAYLLGSVTVGYLIAKWARGIDIRQYGSGNIGAANVLTTVSKRWSIPVIIFDLVKGMIGVYMAKGIGLEVYQQVIIGIAAIVGHNWPIFLHFSGGRGLLTTLGVVFAFSPLLALVLAAIAFAGLPFRQLALGNFIALILLPAFSWFLSGPFGIDKSLTLTLGFVAIFLIVTLRRLTAPRTSVTEAMPQGELLINRLFFDRDVRDREAWIRRKPS